MKLKQRFVFETIGDSCMAVPIGEESEKLKGFIKLNETAKSVFELLLSEISEEQLITELQKSYENVSSDAVNKLLDKLEVTGLLER